MSLKNYTLNKFTFLNFLIALIPFSLIFGNLVTNINIFLIIILGVLIFKNKIFIIEKKLINILIYSFFFYIIIITYFNNLSELNTNNLYKEHILKSFFYLRFFFLFLIINKLIEIKEFNTKIFFLFCAFCSFFISIDIIIQFSFGKNILGYPILIDKPSSFFKSENIAGGFLQRFIYFFIFYIFLIKKDKTNINFLILIFFIFFLLPITFTANRMPTLLYVFSIIVYFLLEKKIKNIFLSLIIIAIIIFSFSKIPLASKRLSTDLSTFFYDSTNIVINAPKLFYKNEPIYNFKRNHYLLHFNSGIQIWKKNKIFGNGLKSFRLKCTYENYQICNTHPHNYFIEILVDTGLIGIFLIYSIFILGLINFFNNYFSSKDQNTKLIFATFFLSIFLEFFPFRSSGSFFTTSNSAFIFLILPLFLNLEKIKKL